MWLHGRMLFRAFDGVIEQEFSFGYTLSAMLNGKRCRIKLACLHVCVHRTYGIPMAGIVALYSSVELCSALQHSEPNTQQCTRVIWLGKCAWNSAAGRLLGGYR